MPRDIQSSTWASVMSNARSKPARELPSNSRPSTSWLPWSLSHSHATERYEASRHRRTECALTRTSIHDRIRTSMVTLSTRSGVQSSSVPSHSTPSLKPTRNGLHSLRLRCARRVAKSVSPSPNWTAPSSPPRAPTKSTPTSRPRLPGAQSMVLTRSAETTLPFSSYTRRASAAADSASSVLPTSLSTSLRSVRASPRRFR